jgi:hypothetical protein
MRPDPPAIDPAEGGRRLRKPAFRGVLLGNIRAAVLPKWQRYTAPLKPLPGSKYPVFDSYHWFSAVSGRVARHLLSSGEPV